jgi:hypothetical protein
MLSGCTPGDKYLRSDAPGVGIEVAATDTDRHSIAITASSSWMFNTAGMPEWLDLRYDDNSSGLLWVGALTRNESLDSLRTTITIVSGDGLRLEIPFVQLPMEVSFAVTPRTVEPFGPRETASRTLNVASTLTWEHLTVGGSDWLTMIRDTDPDSGAERLTVNAAPTRELDPRRDTIVVRPVNETFHGYSDSIAVVQRGIDLVVWSDAMNETTFEIGIPAEGGEVAMSVFSRNAWTVASDASPDLIALDIAEGEADIENGIPVIITAAPNTTTEDHTFTLTFTADGETYEYTCTQQGGAAPPPPQEEEQQRGNEGT